MDSGGTRVVLVKPGDVLVFGRVGAIEPQDAERLVDLLKSRLGIAHIVLFADDIDLAVVPAPGKEE